MMQALLTRDGFEIQEAAKPEIKPDQVLIRSLANGVCEGDIQTYKIKESLTNPILLGHEGTGVITEVGSQSKGFKEGEIVTALGGAYADYFTAKPDSLVKLTDNLDPLFTLGEPVACCVHASTRFGIQPSDRVAIERSSAATPAAMRRARLPRRVCLV